MFTLDNVIERVDPLAELFIDFETNGLYGKIVLAQFMQRGWSQAMLVANPEVQPLADFLQDKTLIGHVIHYEISCLQQQLKKPWVPTSIGDTFLAARLFFYTETVFTLDAVLYYCLGKDPYEAAGLNKKELQKSDWSSTLTEDQKLYASIDVFYLPQIYDKVKPACDSFCYELDILTVLHCASFQTNGFPVDTLRLLGKIEEVELAIDTFDLPVNVNSPKQVTKWLDLEDSTARTLTYVALDERCFMHNEAAQVLALRKLRKQLSFMNKFINTADPANNVHGKFNPLARSGRLTCKDQNLQQIPRALKVCFGVQNDEVLIYSDYAQIELRHICAMTGCKRMAALFREGVDLHSYTARHFFNTDDKEHRQIAKGMNFQALYAGGINTIRDYLAIQLGLVFDPNEVKAIRGKWRRLWPEIYAWQLQGIEDFNKGKHGSTPLGRRYSSDRVTEYLNIQNQGGAADVNKVALHYIMTRLEVYNEENDTDYRIVNNIHDSFIIRGCSKPEHYKNVSKLVASSMRTAWVECSKGLVIRDLPMPVSVSVGYNWGDIENNTTIWSFEL